MFNAYFIFNIYQTRLKTLFGLFSDASLPNVLKVQWVLVTTRNVVAVVNMVVVTVLQYAGTMYMSIHMR